MDENKNFDFEENSTPVGEDNAAEEVVDDITAVEDEIFEPVDETEDVQEPEYAAQEPVYEMPQIDEPAKKGGAGKVVAIVIVIVAILAAAGFGIFKYVTRNPYNELGYINVSGRTIGEVAQQAGYETVAEFLAEYSLPADMPEDTHESAAYYCIPIRKIAEMYGMDVAQLKELLGLGEDVTEETPWGEAEGKATLGKYIGEENLEAFKAQYGLGEDVTAETLWGDIRNIVDQKSLDKQKEAEQAANQSAENDVAVGDDADVAGDAEIAAPESDGEAEAE